ncbi:MAG: YitT family protein [Alloprevotella sp.]|nr:YitT family protein [Alloprevotella sp.]
MWTTKKALQEANDYFFITLGCIIYAIGINCFMLPYQITSGGVAGIGALVFYGFGIPQAYTYLLINLVLLIVAIKELGFSFSIKTIFAVFVLTFLLEFIRVMLVDYGHMHAEEFDIIYNNMPQIVHGDAFMSTILGSACAGVGLGIVFLHNGSTGGTDIIAAVINKYRDVTLGQTIMLTDIIIVSCSLLLPGYTISRTLYGYTTLIIVSLLLDFVVDSGRQSVQFFIFSQRYGDIATAINKTGRGVTVLNGEGWYTHKETHVLVVLAKKRESTNLFRIIHSIDPNAFVSQSKVIGVFGYGFDHMKVKDHSSKNPKISPNSPKPQDDAPTLTLPEWVPQENPNIHFDHTPKP